MLDSRLDVGEGCYDQRAERRGVGYCSRFEFDVAHGFAAALEKEYKTVKYKAYPNEGYYVQSLSGTRQMWLDMLDWFDRYLKD